MDRLLQVQRGDAESPILTRTRQRLHYRCFSGLFQLFRKFGCFPQLPKGAENLTIFPKGAENLSIPDFSEISVVILESIFSWPG